MNVLSAYAKRIVQRIVRYSYRAILSLMLSITIGATSVAATPTETAMLEVAETCRQVISKEGDILEALFEQGYRLPNMDEIERVAEIESYASRLRRSINSATLPNPQEFSSEQQRSFDSIISWHKTSFIRYLVHPDIDTLFVYAQINHKRYCGFTAFKGDTVPYSFLGYSKSNANSKDSRRYETRGSYRILTFPTKAASSLGWLNVYKVAPDTSLDFGDNKSIVTWGIGQ